MDDWKSLLRSIAPALGSSIAGPLGGVAASFIANKLGIEEKTVESITKTLSENKLSPDQVTQIKTAEIEFQKFLKTNEIDLAKISVDNTKDARAMQVNTRSWVPSALAIIITVGYLGILVGLMLGVLQVADNQVLLILIGALATGFGTVLNFFLGSSHSSAQKTTLLAKADAIK